MVIRRRLIISVALLLVHIVAVTCKSCDRHSNCKCVFSDGSGMIDLTSIGKTDGNPLFQDLQSTSDSYWYSYNPCGAFTEVSCVNVAACQYDPTYYVFYDIGVPDEATFNYDGTNVVVQYASQDGTRTSFVTLVCDPNQAQPKLDVQGETSTTKYYFTLTSSTVCPEPYSGDGLSAGSVLLIIFFTVGAVYLIAGASFMKIKQGASGKDVVPNIGFWTTLPGLIRDGCALTLGLICRKRSVYVSM